MFNLRKDGRYFWKIKNKLYEVGFEFKIWIRITHVEVKLAE
jgi:hypothetical protein